MGTTDNLEKLSVDDMKGNLNYRICLVNEDYRNKCEENIGSFVLSVPKLPPDTLEHSYATTMKVVAPCVPSVVTHWFPLPSENNQWYSSNQFLRKIRHFLAFWCQILIFLPKFMEMYQYHSPPPLRNI